MWNSNGVTECGGIHEHDRHPYEAEGGMIEMCNGDFINKKNEDNNEESSKVQR